MKTENNEYYLYILMRNDLPSMGPGRACAQASHASNAFIDRFGRGANIERLDVMDWSRETSQGFGTTIVLSLSLSEIENLFLKKELRGWFVKDYVHDPDYVISVPSEFVKYIRNEDILNEIENSEDDSSECLFHRNEITCAYIFGKKEELKPYLSEFPLYP